MNYTELQKVNDLLGEIKEIDFYLRMVEGATGNIRISINNHIIFFNNKYKVKFVAIMKEIRNELIEELKELGVVEDK
uniref:Uncharacterized protein n=1 Tax=Siphoviridae sp. ct8eQ1 TaxID=2826171 RepID=A0A8S5MZ99_9CAUD|nr:MAG TPA: hypothetical protein [Siphoviridae sp. ct8eQ1]